MNANLFNQIINFLTISLLEETYLVCFVLILMRKYEMLKPSKKNYLIIAAAVFASAMLNNVISYIGIDQTTVFIASSVFFMVVMAIVTGAKTPKRIAVVCLSVLAALVSYVLIESAYIPVVLAGLEKPIEWFNDKLFYKFLLSIPERCVELLIIVFFITRKFKFHRENPIKDAEKSKFAMIASICTLVLNIAVILDLTYQIHSKNILSIMDAGTRLMFMIRYLCFPILNLTLLRGILYYKSQRAYLDEMVRKGEVKSLTALAIKRIKNGEYESAKVAIDNINKAV